MTCFFRDNIYKFILNTINTCLIALTCILTSSCGGDINEENLLSIVVAVYNTGQYVSQCMDSLINQTYKNIEIICVNDGSTDNSLDILNEYRDKDNRVVVLEQENRGVSSARNRGLEVARGKYITFVDSDDFLDLDVYEKCLQRIQEQSADIVIFDFVYEPPDKSSPKLEDKIYENPFEAIKDKNICAALWNKIYKREIIVDNKIMFKEDVSYGEDLLFKLMSFPKAKKIVLFPGIFYHYRIFRKDSAENTLSVEKRIISAINVNKYLIDDYVLNGYNKNDVLLEHSFDATRYVCNMISRLEDTEKQKYYSREFLEILDNKLDISNLKMVSSEDSKAIDSLRKYASS